MAEEEEVGIFSRRGAEFVWKRVGGDRMPLTPQLDEKPWDVIEANRFFVVVVKSNGGSDGSSSAAATWAYDLYVQGDTIKLNASALQPLNSPARAQYGKVTKAPDGSVAMAFYNADGSIGLWSCQEKRAAPTVCE